MGPFSKIKATKPNKEATVHAQDEAPQFEHVTWYRDPGLRALYWHAFILCIASASTGYDGMFFNSVQNFESWKEYFDSPSDHLLGLLAALYQIGSLASIPIVPNADALFRLEVVAWTSFGTNFLNNQWSWRIPALLQALPSVVQVVGIWWVPESPRYLIANDKLDDAMAILAKYHANGNVDHPTVKFEYREITETIKMEQAAKNHSSYLDFFRTPGNRYRFMILISLGIFSQWSGNAIISNYTNILYDNAGITGSTEKLGLSGGSSMVSLIVSISFALLVDRFGRRPIFLLSTGGMFGTFIFWTLTCALYEEYSSPGANHAMIFFIWVFNVAYAIAWSGLLISYAVEILPYTLRAKGLMILNIAIQSALTLNNYANPVALDYFEGETWKLYLIYTCWIFLELCFVFFKYVETKGPTLEELAKVIDGENAQVAQLDIQQIEKEARIHNGRDSEHADGAPQRADSLDNKGIQRS
ncbi:Lactose permease [Colletotrichum sp. SAR 10_70]|nr:Lactose permease [Colletotrichum sp. SAR 10_65]KAI8169953.1 Lactose permease [Colletotrichum sp. SAR 10_71]KAI8202789.1 Lactose permease [Colletotrichum sp. SAR 10_70]KAI8223181.1 Lactose permease [Colletotrichum sp. SAR 10_86]KAJ5007757.1 Lactose permease [Colletotrichum sp. SAR 10_66]